MIITIGGTIGSGKTTLARELAKKFKLKHISAGMIMRDMAEKTKMSVEEFSKYAESDSEIDLEIDRQQKEKVKGNCVVDGRLSGHFLNADLKIWLKAPIDIRIDRIAERDKKTKEDAKKDLIDRENSERKRYMEVYGINIDDMSIYDLVIDSNRFNVESIAEIVSTAVKNI
ncbi:MAG: AAA family ATPase [Candidatus Altiarchaeota archaeon]|nr:AAA family ATPase [Candidatus Altiarchaeota archaeon]